MCRKPMKKEKNGTNCGEDVVSSFKKSNSAAMGSVWNPKDRFPANHKVNEVWTMQSNPVQTHCVYLHQWHLHAIHHTRDNQTGSFNINTCFKLISLNDLYN